MKFTIFDKYHSKNNISTKTSDHVDLNLRLSVSSHQGERKYMEDEFSIVHYQSSSSIRNKSYDNSVLQKSFIYFGIFDGHGGDMAARYTRQNLCKNIVSQRRFWSNKDDQVCLAIHKGFVRTQKAMMKEVVKWPKTNMGFPSTSGTTASVVFIMDGKYYTGHVGDSRIVLGRQSSTSNRWIACPMTRDHKPESIKERERIEATGGQVMNKSGIGRVVWHRPRINILNSAAEVSYDLVPFLSVARSLGDLWSLNRKLNKFVVSPEPDVKCVPIDISDRCLILASDGLWNIVPMKQAVKVIQNFEEEGAPRSTRNDPSLCWISAMMNQFKTDVELNEIENSHSLKLLNVCLNKWEAKRIRADNTTVLVVMLDHQNDDGLSTNGQTINEIPYSQTIIDPYDFDINDMCDSFANYEDSMIGDTIHSLQIFDKKQTDENYIETTKLTEDETEIEIVLSGILNRICSLNPNENELLDDEQLSVIDFSRLSSQQNEKEKEEQTSLFIQKSKIWNNFNCTFQISTNHIVEENDNQTDLDDHCQCQASPSSTTSETISSNLSDSPSSSPSPQPPSKYESIFDSYKTINEESLDETALYKRKFDPCLRSNEVFAVNKSIFKKRRFCDQEDDGITISDDSIDQSIID